MQSAVFHAMQNIAPLFSSGSAEGYTSLGHSANMLLFSCPELAKAFRDKAIAPNILRTSLFGQALPTAIIITNHILRQFGQAQAQGVQRIVIKPFLDLVLAITRNKFNLFPVAF